MAIFKIHKDSNFTVLDNGIFYDRDISLKALGLLCKMLSLPSDWNFTMAGLAAISKDNTTAVKSALDELQKLGYVKITKKYPNETDSGRIEYIYDVFEIKQAAEKQDLEILPLEIQPIENRALLNTNIVRTKEEEKKENKNNGQVESSESKPRSLEDIRKELISKKSAPDNRAVSVIEKLNELAGTRYRASKNSLQPIVARLNEGFTLEELLMVVEYKCQEWKGTDMQKYLRPETLFRPSKFEGYLNAAISKAPIHTKGRNCADSCSSKTSSPAFKDLSPDEQKSRLSGIKF